MAASRARSSRSLGLDVLRAVAALMVIGFHAYGGAFGFGLYTLRGAPFDLVDHLAGGVYLFFALSGYLISRPFVAALVRGEELPALLPYARRRVLRIFPLYLLTLVIELTVTNQWHTPPLLLVAHVLLLHNLVRGQSNAIFVVSWTLSLELLFYAFLPIAALSVRRSRKGPVTPKQLAVGIGLLWMASFVWALAVGLQHTSTTTTWLGYAFPAMVGMFCPGMLAAVAEHRRPRQGGLGDVLERLLRQPALVLASVVLLYVVSSALAATGGRQLGTLVSHHVDAVAYGLLVAMVLRVELPRRRWVGGLSWLGLISYGIYLWQGVLGDLWAHHPRYFPLLHHPLGVASIPVVFVLVLVPTVVVSWASWTWLETPFLRLAQRHVQRTPIVPAVTG